MKPIAQTFYINEPAGGAPGVYLTSIDLFFRKKSDTFGVTVYINTTDNGNPTPTSLAFSNATLGPNFVNVSEDASVATKFTFASPLFLQTNVSYAILVVPDGGNPDYEIWTSTINGFDVTNQTPVKTNNDIGTLFLSSNDIQFTAVQNEDMKFNLYVADFSKSGGSGKAVFTSDQEKFYVNDLRGGNFISPEIIFVSNDAFGFTLAKLSYSSNTGPLNVGEIVYQNDGYSNTAYGKIHTAGSGIIKISNTVGSWSSLYQIKGKTTGSNAVISAVSQNTVTVASTNTVSVPYTDYYYAGQWVYLSTNDRSQTWVYAISQVLNSTTLQLSRNVDFSESDALIGQINGNGRLYGNYFGVTRDQDIRDPDNIRVLSKWNRGLDETNNNYQPFNNLLIGNRSHASAVIKTLRNYAWNSAIPQFSSTAPPDTAVDFVIRGAKNTSGYGVISAELDSTEYPVQNNLANEFYDEERMILSRSNEIAQMGGTSTMYVGAYMNTANNLVSPIIDNIRTFVTTTHNYTYRADEIDGVVLSISNNDIVPGEVRNLVLNDNIVQKNTAGDTVIATGSILDISTTKITVGNVVGTFQTSDTASGVMRIIAGDVVVPAINAYVTGITSFNETLNVNQYYSSRYISKNIVLDEGQDAEDIICYLTAYRPATTDFQVYAKLLNSQDSDSISTKLWSRLEEKSSAALLSSKANLNDFVELVYGFPVSKAIINQDANTLSTSSVINMTSTANFAANDYVYIQDNNATNFNVKRVVSVANNTALNLNSNVTFTTTNAAVGVIPNLNDLTSAFVYTENNNTVRYVSNNNVIFDTYKTFAIKIVPVSETSYIIPRASDMRCIALQI